MEATFRPTWEIGASIGVHLLVVGLLALGQLMEPEAPLFDPNDVMTVQAVALPKANTRMPDRPTRAPPPQRVTPPRPRLRPRHRPRVTWRCERRTPRRRRGVADRSADRSELLNRLKRESLLKDATAALGTKDRVQTAKDGVDPKDAVIGPIGAGRMDPELARYVSQCRDRILPNWKPLPAILAAHPEYKVVVSVSVGQTGQLGSPTVVKSSSDASFDRSAISAVVRTGRLPPPPAKYAASAAKGVMITLSAADLR